MTRILLLCTAYILIVPRILVIKITWYLAPGPYDSRKQGGDTEGRGDRGVRGAHVCRHVRIASGLACFPFSLYIYIYIYMCVVELLS